jgi:lysyl-tRNA synthetase class I
MNELTSKKLECCVKKTPFRNLERVQTKIQNMESEKKERALNSLYHPCRSKSSINIRQYYAHIYNIMIPFTCTYK